MLFFSLLLFFLGLSKAEERRVMFNRCSATVPEGYDKMIAALVAHKKLLPRVDFASSPPPERVVNTYFHVIARDKTEHGGNLKDSVLQKQLEVLNDAFAPANFEFKLVNTSRTFNSKWAKGIKWDEFGQDPIPMKEKLRRGDYASLNVYFLGDISAENLGMCTFPWNKSWGIKGFSATKQKDGCLINSGSVPDGWATKYNMGKTLVHEVGHWLGLHHTYMNGCSEPGDFISDTPPQLKPTKGCPKFATVSCPNQTYPDPIHNYMDYSSDECMTEFTPGQIERMHDLWHRRVGPLRNLGKRNRLL